jgi:thioredoxin reductase (NADPH)
MTGVREVLIVGGGMAGLSAALYIGRSKRDTLLIHSGRSMAKWEVQVHNYLGFPGGIAGTDLLDRGMEQAVRFEVQIVEDEVQSVMTNGTTFHIQGRQGSYDAKRVLIATGLTHLPPDLPGVKECLGKSLFFCKDCDAYRLQGQRIGIIGRNNEAVNYALGMLLFTPSVTLATNGRDAQWDNEHAGWLEEYQIPVRQDGILALEHDKGLLRTLTFVRGEPVQMDAVFTTRGDVPHSALATGTGALVDAEGQIIVDERLSTSVSGLYAAGCVTPANCQMIIAAGQGAIAAQAINRDLFEESLRRHTLPRFGEQTYESKKCQQDYVETQSS